MILSEKSIAEFRKLYRKETGKRISRKKAAEYADRVLRLVDLVTSIRPAPKPPEQTDQAHPT